MSETTNLSANARNSSKSRRVRLMDLVGSGDSIGKAVLPFIAIGVALNFWRPALFEVGGPPDALRAVSYGLLAPGIVVWLWSVFLILTRVPRHELITAGPFALVKHPLYTGVSLLVLPWAGFLLNTWLGLALGVVLYAASRRYAPREEEWLARSFGEEWTRYQSRVLIPWL